MQLIFRMTTLDVYWGIPFLLISFVATALFLDAFYQTSFRRNKRKKRLILDYLSTGDTTLANKIMSYQDTVFKAIAIVIYEFIEENKTDNFKNRLKETFHVFSCEEIPHKNFFSYYCGVILLVGYGGTLISFIFLMNDFNITNNSFSDMFKVMSVGIKSSLFGVAASTLMATGEVYLEKALKKQKSSMEYFYKDIVKIADMHTRRKNPE